MSPRSIDDLIHQIEEDELQDQLETAKEAPSLVAMSPVNYAKARKIAPQRVYGAIRNGRLEKKLCLCGRTIIDVAAADEYFGFAERKGEEIVERGVDLR